MKLELRDRVPQVVRDGMWTLLTHGGSKLLAIGQLFWVSRAGGPEALGQLVIATATAVIAATVADFGASTSLIRHIATPAPDSASRRTIAITILRRSALGFVIGSLILGGVLAASHSASIALIALSSAYAFSFTASNLAMAWCAGLGLFRDAALTIGLMRSVALLACAASLLSPQHAAPILLGLLAVTEATIAALLASRAARQQGPSVEEGSLHLSKRYGLPAIVNVLINRADAAVIGAATTVQNVGIYGTASQMQNAVTTVSLTPASALMTHAARQPVEPGKDGLHLVRPVLLSVATLSIAIALAVITAAPALIQPVLAIDNLAIPLIIVMSGAPFSACAGVFFTYLLGTGHPNLVTLSWGLTAVISLPLMLALAANFGATGAAVGSLVRDCCMLTLALVMVRTRHVASNGGLH